MAKNGKKNQIVTRKLAALKPHSKQAGLFGNMSAVELDELAADLDRNGLLHEVEILPDGTIIAGHQRVRAAKKLGWTKIKCWVRADLAEAGDEAVELRLIEDNLNRRQLGLLAQIRCYVRAKELAQSGQSSGNQVRGDVRDQIAKRFNKSGRTLDRWAALLRVPIELQRAVDAGQVPIVAASKVAGLDKDLQKRVTKRIRAGEPPDQVVKEALGGNGDSVGHTWALISFFRSLRRGVDRLKDRKQFDLQYVREADPALLRDAKALINRLIRELK